MDDTEGWTAVVQTGSQRGYGTSEADINAYGAAGGAAAGAAVCAAYGAALASPLCAAIGGKVGAAVTSAIQSIGKSLFGGSELQEPNDVWNPVADAVITKIVLELRRHRGLDVRAPGGSARNFPEWNAVASRWASHVNRVVAEHGGPIVWFYDAGPNAGRIRGEAVTQWEKCGRKKQYALMPPPPRAQCFNAKGESASKYLPEAAVRATERTASEMLRPSRAWLWFGIGVAAFGAWYWWHRAH